MLMFTITKQPKLVCLHLHADHEIHSIKSLDKSIKDIETILPIGNQLILAEKRDDEKLAIALLVVGTGLIAYHLW